MKQTLLAALLTALLALGAWTPIAWAQTPEPFAKIAHNAVVHAIRPGVSAYADAAASLPPAMERLCTAPGQETLDAARAAFTIALDAWSRVEFIRFGPSIAQDRLERTLFWPDPRGIGLRQVQALLAEPDESATSPASLAGKSVALQGFPALEFVLFGTGADALTAPGDPFRCAYAHAIAGNLLSIARENAQAWASDDLAILNPGPENPAYRTGQEAMLEIAQTLATGLEIIADFKLRRVLGGEIDKAKPRSAIFRRSGQSLAIIRANIAGLRALFDAADFPPLLTAEGHSVIIARSIAFEFGNADRVLESVTLPLDEAVLEADLRGRLDAAVITLNSLRTSIGQTLLADLGLALGFNSMDGD